MDTIESGEHLVGLIRQKRQQLENFLAEAGPRKRRLVNTTILGGSIAATLTAVPAIAGQTFTNWLTGLLGLTSPSWRLLCAAASLCALAATVATQLLKSNNMEEQVSKAQGCRAKLEVLEVALAMGQLDLQRGLAEYLSCIEETSFLETYHHTT